MARPRDPNSATSRMVAREPQSDYAKLIHKMMIDYVVHNLSQEKLSEKYQMTNYAVGDIIHTYKFKQKKAKFHDDILKRGLEKLVIRQAYVFQMANVILEKQLRAIRKYQYDNPDKMLDSNRMKEVLAAISILAKEHRLDMGQPTENTNITIKVDIPDIPIVTENHIINAESEVKTEVKLLNTFSERSAEFRKLTDASEKQTFSLSEELFFSRVLSTLAGKNETRR